MHVQDLRWIVNLVVGAAFLAILVYAVTAWYIAPKANELKLYEALLPFTISAVLAGLGGIIAWCYQTGSNRLGIVDLFACEITTLCRVCTVIGLADTCIAAFELEAREQSLSDQGKIKERAIQPIRVGGRIHTHLRRQCERASSLGVKVVINITAFYTYWKGHAGLVPEIGKDSGMFLVS